MNMQPLHRRALALVAGVVVLAFSSFASADPPSRVARLGYMNGAVSFSPAGESDWVQATIAPASERTTGWALDGKVRWLRAGVERNSRYDFTNLDNTIFTLGFELNLDPPH